MCFQFPQRSQLTSFVGPSLEVHVIIGSREGQTRAHLTWGGGLPSEGFHKTDFKCLFEVRQLVLFMMMNMFSPKA